MENAGIFRFDGNGNRYADGANDKIMGNALPTFFAGLTNNFSLGRWSLSVFANTTRGFYVCIIRTNALFLKGSIKTAHNVTYAVANSNEKIWSTSGQCFHQVPWKKVILSGYQMLTWITSSIWNQKQSAHCLPLSLVRTALFTNYSGTDPEVNVDKSINGIPSRGFDYAGYQKHAPSHWVLT